jgi:hypothetical protein
MRHLAACLSLACLAPAALAASALEALRLLGPDYLQNLALVAARDGSPEPQRWHILLHDPRAETGLREIVVTDGKKTAERSVSQFAERLTAADILGPDSVRIDSPQLGKLALQFGLANQLNVSALHYDLRKSGPEAAPLWTVTCLDANGSEVGKLIVSATRGTVLMHPGFAEAPEPLVPIAAPSKIPNPGEREVAAKRNPGSTAPKRRATPAPPAPTPKPGMFQRLFGGGQKKP